jgi:hypothetical protein
MNCTISVVKAHILYCIRFKSSRIVLFQFITKTVGLCKAVIISEASRFLMRLKGKQPKSPVTGTKKNSVFRTRKCNAGKLCHKMFKTFTGPVI